MKLRVNGQTYRGEAVDLRAVDDVSAAELVEAIRAADATTVRCPTPSPIHEHVGLVSETRALSVRGALASVARTRGHSAPQDEEIAWIRDALADWEPETETADLERCRKQLTTAGSEEEGLSERMSELRGQIKLLRRRNEPTDEVLAELREIGKQLSSASTERLAAEQALERERKRARELRDTREQRLEQQDRVANLERQARSHLASKLYDEFRAAVRAVPGAARPGSDPSEYDGDSATAALAIAKLATLSAPIVLDCDRFPSADAAQQRLQTPVIRL